VQRQLKHILLIFYEELQRVYTIMYWTWWSKQNGKCFIVRQKICTSDECIATLGWLSFF